MSNGFFFGAMCVCGLVSLLALWAIIFGHLTRKRAADYAAEHERRFQVGAQDGDLVADIGDFLTCSAGHKCARFNERLREGDILDAQTMTVVQEGFRLRQHRIIPPCYECGRMTVCDTGGFSLNVNGEWRPPLMPSDAEAIAEIEAIESEPESYEPPSPEIKDPTNQHTPQS